MLAYDDAVNDGEREGVHLSFDQLALANPVRSYRMRTSNAPYAAAGLETNANCVSVLKVETSRLTGGAFRHFIKGIVRYEHSLEGRKTKGKLAKSCKLLGRAQGGLPAEKRTI